MNQYVLILMLWHSHGAGLSMETFNTREACEEALKAAKELAPGGTSALNSRGVCVKR